MGKIIYTIIRHKIKREIHFRMSCENENKRYEFQININVLHMIKETSSTEGRKDSNLEVLSPFLPIK